MLTTKTMMIVIPLSAACGETLQPQDPENAIADCVGGANLTVDPLNCGKCGVACAASESCRDSHCSATPPTVDLALYVDDTRGDDVGALCSREKPCKTIVAALRESERRQLKDQEVRVCEGTYRETALVLDRAMSIRGAYDCATWARDAKALYPTFDTTTNETRIENADPNVDPKVGLNTLLIRGPAVTRAALIDGVHVVGAGNTSNGAAIRVVEGAAPTIADNVIDAVGATPADSIYAYGIAVLNSPPEILHNKVAANTNMALRGNFTGISLEEATASVHDNVIDGGAGGGQVIGISMRGGSAVGKNAISANRIQWTSADNSGSGISAFQLQDIEVVGNAIAQGTLTCTAGQCVSYGIHVTGAAKVTVAKNRIRGASSQGVADTGLAGIRASLSTSVDITDNMIHTGNLGNRQSSFPTGITIGSQNGSMRIVHNTIVIYDPPLTKPIGVDLLTNSQGAIIDNNLFVGTSGAAALGIFDEGTASITSVRGNGFINTALMLRYGPNDDGTIGALESNLKFSGAAATDNIRIATTVSCNSSTDCGATCGGDPAKCTETIFGTWKSGLFGADEAIETGFKIMTPLCILTEGGQVLATPPAISTDHFGTPRTPKTSIGAHEVDTTCIPR